MLDSNEKIEQLKNKILDVSKDIFNTAPPQNNILEYYLYCSQQATHQIEVLLKNKTVSHKEQLNGFYEWSMNLVNYSCLLLETTCQLKKQIEDPKTHFSTGYGRWFTNVDYIRKELNESCNEHYKRISGHTPINIIDSLKILYHKIYNIKDKETQESILKDEKIKLSVELYIKNQCLSNFILCYDDILKICSDYSINLNKLELESMDK